MTRPPSRLSADALALLIAESLALLVVTSSLCSSLVLDPITWPTPQHPKASALHSIRPVNPRARGLRRKPALGLSSPQGPSGSARLGPKYSRRQDRRFHPPKGNPRSISFGLPQRGRLTHALQLPADPALYRRAKPSEQYGADFVVRALREALKEYRRAQGPRPRILVGDLSLPHGGPFPPHKSHQNGRDVDIHLPRIRDGQGRRSRIDWQASWRLIEALRRNPLLHKIFLSAGLHASLAQAARQLGVAESQITRIIQFPGQNPKAIVRHSPGHDRHIHLRYRCPPAGPPSTDPPPCQAL